MIKTELCDLLGIKYPIIQAGMGPLNTKKLASAVSNAGGMGTLSIHHMRAEPPIAYKIYTENIKYIVSHTKNNFACNVPVGVQIGETFLKTTDAYMNAIFDAREEDPEVAKRLRLLITSAGNPERYIKRIKDSGLIHFHVVGSVRQAKKAENMGVDAVIASGFEMGGHTHRWPNVIHTFILVPSVADAVQIPVIASGGVCDAKSFVAALAMGAVGVQMGTRFGATVECDFHENYKMAIVNACEHGDTLCPGAYSYLRVIKSKGAQEAIKMAESGEFSPDEMVVAADKKLVIAEKEGDVDEGEVGAGQVCSRIHELKTVSDVIQGIIKEGQEIIKNLNGKL
ncbi:MAG TPA: nitronate monooxygenase [Desulfobacteraceae bacterium]|nr:nitronate monooxygenase [Desulfobacteraceae bacterium]